MKQYMDDCVWSMVQEFYQSMALYLTQYNFYNERVMAFAHRLSTDRHALRLNAAEVSSLLDFKKLEELRNDHIRPLKLLSHTFFRTHSSTDRFDRYVSDIFHEVSILKEQHYKVKVYAPAYMSLHDHEEAASIVEEVHEFFPRKLEHIYTLFHKAKSRLEELLPHFRHNTILIRSLFLYGEEIVAQSYDGQIAKFYQKMYPEGGKMEAYLQVALSFKKSCFYEHAQKAVQAGLAEAGTAEQNRQWVEVFQKVLQNCTNAQDTLDGI